MYTMDTLWNSLCETIAMSSPRSVLCKINKTITKVIASYGAMFQCHIMCSTRKGPICTLRKRQVQISLCISEADQGLYCPLTESVDTSICWWAENAQIRLHGYACWSVPTLSTNCIRAFFMCCASYVTWKDSFVNNKVMCTLWKILPPFNNS